MAGNSGIGWFNWFKTGGITALSEEPSLPSTNLSGDLATASMGWQTIGGVLTSGTGAVLRCTFPAPALVCRAWGLFGTNLTLGASVTATLYLSGSPSVVATMTVIGVHEGYAQIVGVFDQDYTADYIEFEINDPTNNQGFINIGAAFAGPIWFPQTGITFDSTQALFVPTRTNITTRGGQEWVTTQYTKRWWSFALDYVRRSEQYDMVGDLFRVAARGVNVLVFSDGTSVDIGRDAVFGLLSTQADMSFASKYYDAIKVSFTVTERL